MEIVNPVSGSIIKIIITLMLWVSFFSALSYTIENYNRIKIKTPKISQIIYLLLIVWNVINILRSLLDGNVSIKTMFGNPTTSLSLLIPIVGSFGIFQTNLTSFRKILFSLLILGFIAVPISFPFIWSQNLLFMSIYFVLFSGSIFLIPTILYEKKLNKLMILLSCPIMIIFIAPEVRTILLRDILLLIPVISIYIFQKFHLKIIFSLSLLTLLIPLYLLYDVYKSDKSIFQSMSELSDSEETDDTRTFLYQELFADLIKTKSLIAGKGAYSTYYSEYFSNNEGDSDTRMNVEVAFLETFLRGGIIAVILNLSLFVYAIYISFFKSNNYYSIAIGYFLLVHVLLWFVEDILSFSIYNFIVWFCVGLCLNNQFRKLTNKELTVLINKKLNENFNRYTFIQSRAIH